MWKVAGVLMSRGLYDGIMDFLTGTGLAASAGLNAYIPFWFLAFLTDTPSSSISPADSTGFPTAG